MTYKLMAIDLDGTLLSSSMNILPQTKRVIVAAIRKGLIVTLATGRPFCFAQEVAKELMINTPLITHDGALVTADLDQPLFVDRLSNSTARGIVRILFEYPLRFELQHDPLSYANYMIPNVEPADRGSFKSLEHKIIKSMDNHKILSYLRKSRLEPYKISVSADTQDILEEIKGVLLSRFPDEIRITNAGFGLEIVPKRISKANGLMVLSHTLRITPAEMIAIGDNFNDIEMIQWAGLGIAMGNAPQEVKNAANYVTRTNDENGIAHAMHTILDDQVIGESI